MNTSSSSIAMWSFWVGTALVIATHFYMLVVGVPQAQMTAHATLNLIAAALIVFGWMKR